MSEYPLTMSMAIWLLLSLVVPQASTSHTVHLDAPTDPVSLYTLVDPPQDPHIADNKVPDSFSIRILRAQKDQQTQQVNYEHATQAAKDAIAAYAADTKEIDVAKLDALKAMNKDPEKWDIDPNLLVVVPKAPVGKGPKDK